MKAAVESSLGKLGTVGALAIDEFVAKRKDAMRETEHQLSLHEVVGSASRPSSYSGSVAGSVASGAVPGAQGSSAVLSESCECSVVPSGLGSSGVVSV